MNMQEVIKAQIIEAQACTQELIDGQKSERIRLKADEE
jgi:hypothetical protein